MNLGESLVTKSEVEVGMTMGRIWIREQAPLGVRSISTQIVRNRMKSVKNIQKITKAMKMVAASKLRAIQIKAENSRGIWQPFTALLGDNPSVDVKKNVIITVSSDKGLCGGINSTSVKMSKALQKLTSGPEKQSTYVILGEKAKAQFIRDSKNNIELCITELQRNPLNYTQSSIESSKLSIKENVVNARSAVKIYSSGDSGQQGFSGFRSCNVRPYEYQFKILMSSLRL
uniref:ATP synthase subunit gamma n=1 Tax=Quercus lobata TaxID=97700 RepID=A0A7N2RBS9_QUELO